MLEYKPNLSSPCLVIEIIVLFEVDALLKCIDGLLKHLKAIFKHNQDLLVLSK